MYFYTPVITSPYEDFVETFGRRIDFGYYCENNIPQLIEHYIMKLLDNASYESLCINAHKSVEKFTWSAYVEKFMEEINNGLMTGSTI